MVCPRLQADHLFSPSRRESCYTPSPPSETIIQESVIYNNPVPSSDPGPSSIMSVQSTNESISGPSTSSSRPSMSPVPTIESKCEQSTNSF
jgi:hypothetical protein